MLACMMHVLSL